MLSKTGKTIIGFGISYCKDNCSNCVTKERKEVCVSIDEALCLTYEGTHKIEVGKNTVYLKVDGFKGLIKICRDYNGEIIAKHRFFSTCEDEIRETYKNKRKSPCEIALLVEMKKGESLTYDRAADMILNGKFVNGDDFSCKKVMMKPMPIDRKRYGSGIFYNQETRINYLTYISGVSINWR